MRRALLVACALLSAVVVAPARAAEPATVIPSSMSTSDQAAVLAGRAWSTSTGNISIPANKVLDVVLANPTGNACTPLLVLRRFTNASTSQLSFQTFANPGALAGATSAPIGNRLVGSTTSSGLSMSFAVQNAGQMTGTPGVAAPLLATTENDITVATAVMPGKALGLELTGLSGALAGPVTVSVTFAGFCS